jgi:hypothetical protein
MKHGQIFKRGGSLNNRIALALVLAFCIIFPGLAEAEKTGSRVWLLQEGEILEYAPSTWTVINTIKVPKEISQDPERLQITRTGEMLFCLDPQMGFGNPKEHFALDKAWIWDGRTAALLDRKLIGKSVSAGGDRRMVTESKPWLSLSSDGRQLYWFANESTRLKRENGEDLSVSTAFRVWQTNLAGLNPAQIVSYSFRPCKCETGACADTCPEADFWFPEDGVDDFFIVSHWIPGQLGSEYQSSFLYHKAGGKWASLKSSRVFEDVLDTTRDGNAIIHAVRDEACCGWENDSDDQTMLFAGGKNIVIFDEQKKYFNPDYDISFYTSKAKQSPDGSLIAINIVSTARPGADLRLSNGGKENPGELARIRQTLDTLPAVEAFRIADQTKPLLSLPHASFAGWLNDREILAVENGVLFTFDILKSTRKDTGIKVPKESGVFVR